MPALGSLAVPLFRPMGGVGLRGYRDATARAQTAAERLATGQRINRGADDPSGLITLEGLRSRFTDLDAQVGSIDRDLRWLAAVDGARSVVGDQFLELGGLVRQAANGGGLGEGELEAIQGQIDAVIEGIEYTYNTAQMGGVQLLNIQELRAGVTVEIVEPSPATPGVTSEAPAETTEAAGKDDEDAGPDEDLDGALDEADDAGQARPTSASYSLFDLRSGGALDLSSGEFELMAQVADGVTEANATNRGVIGTRSKSLESHRNTLLAELENVSAAIGEIGDADIAHETAELVRARAMQDVSLMVEQVSRQSAQTVLELITSLTA